MKTEIELAYQVRRALDERAAALPEETVRRLTLARQLAVSRQKTAAPVEVPGYVPRLAGILSSNPLHQSFHWLLRVGIVTPLLVLVLGLTGLYYYEEQRRADELAELDAAVLSDELPIDAYLDSGFENYLKEHGE